MANRPYFLFRNSNGIRLGAEGQPSRLDGTMAYEPIGDSQVIYEGTITEIALVGFDSEAKIEKLLATRGEETKYERPWGRTIYLLTGCRPISPISISTLLKAKDGMPLAEDYRYSYSIVPEHDPTSVE